MRVSAHNAQRTTIEAMGVEVKRETRNEKREGFQISLRVMTTYDLRFTNGGI